MADRSNIFGANLLNQLHLRQITSKLCEPRAFRANLYRERFRLARNLFKTDLHAHYGCVNAIEFSNGGKYLASGGDDKRILIWNIEKAIAGLDRPRVLEAAHTSNIFCLGFDKSNRKVFSGGNDDLVIVHDFETGKLHNVFKHETPVYGLAVDPFCDNIFATASDDGQVLLFDLRKDTQDPLVLAQFRNSFHAVEFHPIAGNFLVTANSKRGAAFWDIRRPHHPVIQYGDDNDQPSCMSVRFNATGQQILALRRRLPPILYNTQSPEPVCTFYHESYYNSCTMKSCTFAGEDDELVLSGSDNFNLYVWRVSDIDFERTDQWIENTQMVLYGHRSIVNQVRYNREKCLLASSGVEKIVKLWSPFEQKGWNGSLLEEATASDNPRELYATYTIPSLSASPQPHSWSHMSHDYSSCNTNEDARMMSFFDTLIQQEIEGWDTNTSGSSTSSSSDNGSVKDYSAQRRKRVRHPVRKKERQRRKKMLNRSKIHRHNYDNRIAYLIATKKYTLRRLALKGASSSNRRPQKVAQSGVVSSRKRNMCVDLCRANTSSSSSTSGYSLNRPQITIIQAINYDIDFSSDGDDEIDPPNAQASSLRNDASFSNNVSIPSTSTGITSSQKDDIIRLRQQQICDDSDEDDEDVSNVTVAEVRVDSAMQPIKKLNGVRRTNDAARSSNSISHSRGHRTFLSRDDDGVPINYTPQVSVVRINTRAAFTNRDNTSAISNGDTHFNETSSVSEHHNRHSISKIINRRPRLGMSHNVPIANEASNNVDVSRTDRVISPPSKRKKISPTNDFYNTSSSNDENESTTPSISGNNNKRPEEHEEHVGDIATKSSSSNNNNNISRNNIRCIKDKNNCYDSSCSDNNSNCVDFDSNTIPTDSLQQNLLQTPDSGISVITITPSCSRNSYNQTEEHSDSGSSNRKSGTNENSINYFYQKVARVRRNYRKQFADGSESD